MMFSIALLEAIPKRISTFRGVLEFQSYKYVD